MGYKRTQKRHKHIRQKFVTYSELKEIMFEMYCQDNLTYCLTFGKNAPDYGEKLMLVAQKLEFVSSLFYLSNGVPKKLPRKTYEKFFDNYVENSDDACERLLWLGGDYRKKAFVYEKYTQIKVAVVPLLCDTDEVWVAGEFKNIIEYIIEHDNLPESNDYSFCLKDADIERGSFYV